MWQFHPDISAWMHLFVYLITTLGYKKPSYFVPMSHFASILQNNGKQWIGILTWSRETLSWRRALSDRNQFLYDRYLRQERVKQKWGTRFIIRYLYQNGRNLSEVITLDYFSLEWNTFPWIHRKKELKLVSTRKEVGVHLDAGKQCKLINWFQ